MKPSYHSEPLGNILVERLETPSIETIVKGEVPIISKITFNDGRIYTRTDGQTNTKMILIRPGDLVISGINAAKGAIAIYKNDNTQPIAATIHYSAYIPNKERVLVEYLWWLLRSRRFLNLLHSYFPDGIKSELKAKHLLPIAVPLPSMDEQHQIVDRIEELAAKIAEARGLRREVTEETKYLSSSFVNILFSNIQWPLVMLGEVADIHAGVTLGRTLNEPTIKLPYLRVANVQDGYFDLSVIKEIDILISELEKWQLRYGDILLTEGGDWDKLGRGAVWRGQIEKCIHQNHIFCVRTKQDDFDPDFLIALISSPYGKSYFQKASKKTTNLASINQKQLKTFKVFQPPLSEQRRIVAYLNSLQSKVDSMKCIQAELNAELDALLPSILDKAFKGEL